jgi:hypothetical protein
VERVGARRMTALRRFPAPGVRSGLCRIGKDPSAVSAGELLRRTLRPDSTGRGHRPDADLRGATSASGACRVRRAVQHRAAASVVAVAAAAPDIASSRTGPRQNPASTDPGRAPQRVRDGSLKPLVTHLARVLEPDRARPDPSHSGPRRRRASRSHRALPPGAHTTARLPLAPARAPQGPRQP